MENVDEEELKLSTTALKKTSLDNNKHKLKNLQLKLEGLRLISILRLGYMRFSDSKNCKNEAYSEVMFMLGR